MINYESPVFVSTVLYTIYALLLLAVGLTVWSAVRGWRRGSDDKHSDHGVPARKIGLAMAGVLAATMAATWLLADTTPLSINGRPYADTFWLRTSDMLINTSLVFIGLIVVIAAISAMRRKED